MNATTAGRRLVLSRFQAHGETTSPPGRTFYAGEAPVTCVKHARQALAIDENVSISAPKPGSASSVRVRS